MSGQVGVEQGSARRVEALHGNIKAGKEERRKKMIYKWKYPLGVPAQVAGEFIAGLEEKHGTVTPELLLNESRDKNAVLHTCFEWDDAKAAEQYRLNQARYIIGTITVEVEVIDNSQPSAVRAFVNVSEETKGKYVSICAAMVKDDYKTRVLKNALSELKAFQNKYSAYVELADVFKVVSEFEEKLKQVK